jgi:hypothetical protein
MHRSPSQEEFRRMFRKDAREWDASGATISGTCCEVAKYTSFLLPEVGPRNSATEEELRNAREKMCPNLMPKDGPRGARISEWEKSGEDSSFISIG